MNYKEVRIFILNSSDFKLVCTSTPLSSGFVWAGLRTTPQCSQFVRCLTRAHCHVVTVNGRSRTPSPSPKLPTFSRTHAAPKRPMFAGISLERPIFQALSRMLQHGLRGRIATAKNALHSFDFLNSSNVTAPVTHWCKYSKAKDETKYITEERRIKASHLCAGHGI